MPDVEINIECERKPIALGWPIGLHSGWGVIALNFALELFRHPQFMPVSLHPINPDDYAHPVHRHCLQRIAQSQATLSGILSKHKSSTIRLGMPVLHALGHEFKSSFSHVVGSPNVGLVVFENSSLTPSALEAAKKFDIVITGSLWNQRVLQQHGVRDVRNCHQGVDFTLFHPAPRSRVFKDRFVVFSGGKLEYRKGQDIVVAAFRELRRKHSDVFLLTMWQNFWPQFIEGIDRRGHVKGVPGVTPGTRNLDIATWLAANGIATTDALDIGAVPNYLAPHILREADIAVFPNRCEGGTNMVAMECLACGVPTVLAANTGQLDLLGEAHVIRLERQTAVAPTRIYPGVSGWGESSVDELVETIEQQIHLTRSDRKLQQNQCLDPYWGWPSRIEAYLSASA